MAKKLVHKWDLTGKLSGVTEICALFLIRQQYIATGDKSIKPFIYRVGGAYDIQQIFPEALPYSAIGRVIWDCATDTGLDASIRMKSFHRNIELLHV